MFALHCVGIIKKSNDWVVVSVSAHYGPGYAEYAGMIHFMMYT